VSNLQLTSAFVGFIVPLVVSFVNQSHWKPQYKGVVAIAISALAAFITSWVAGDLHGKSFATSFLIVLGATLSTYRIFWKPTGIADSVENATTIHKAPSAIAPNATSAAAPSALTAAS
jgi:hypothetical protein